MRLLDRLTATRFLARAGKWPFDCGCKGAKGLRLCRWCGTEVPNKRRTWCSEECVDGWRQYSDPAVRRHRAFERDGGRCQICSLDIAFLHRWLRHAPKKSRVGTRARRLRFLHRRGLLGGHQHLYECDHIVPQVEGGGHEPENLRTLCIPCHKAETAALAARRAEQRRIEKQPAPDTGVTRDQ